MVANGLATTVGTPARLATSSSSPGSSAQPPASTMWSTWLYGVEVKKNCSARVISSASVLHERLQHVGLVVLGQAAGSAWRLGFLGREVERALDVLRQLVAAERLVAGEQDLVVAQDVEVRDVAPTSTSAMFWSRAVRRQRRRDQARTPSCVAYDSTSITRGLQAGGLGDGDAVLDLLLARRGDQHLDFVRVVRRRAEHLEVEVDLVERERNVLVGLGLDLQLELLLALAGGHDDLLGDDRPAGSASATLRLRCRGASRRA